MSVRYAAGKKAKGVCDRCGFIYKIRELKGETIKGTKTNLKVCSTCWNPDHPQLRLGEFPVHDPQGLRDPRPDSNTLASSREIVVPVTPVISTGRVGYVTVLTP
jgi:hypothetical protein